MIVEVIIGNIANQSDIEAVVNSANGNLRLGSGVAGAIHTAAGHGCAVSRSNEAKALGIKMGPPWFQCKALAEEHGILALSSNGNPPAKPPG